MDILQSETINDKHCLLLEVSSSHYIVNVNDNISSYSVSFKTKEEAEDYLERIL